MDWGTVLRAIETNSASIARNLLCELGISQSRVVRHPYDFSSFWTLPHVKKEYWLHLDSPQCMEQEHAKHWNLDRATSIGERIRNQLLKFIMRLIFGLFLRCPQWIIFRKHQLKEYERSYCKTIFWYFVRPCLGLNSQSIREKSINKFGNEAFCTKTRSRDPLRFGLVSLFNGISTFICYLMLKISLYKGFGFFV